MPEWIIWLNTNSGAINAAATSLSATFAAAAAVAAFVSINRSRRRERSNLDVFVNTSESTLNTSNDYQPVVHINVMNRGPASPLFAVFDFDHWAGDRIPTPIAPGEFIELPKQSAALCRKWCRVQISWLEPDGRNRRIVFWYRLEGEWDSPSNNRRFLRVSRDERATHFLGLHYLRRHITPWDYVSWRIRQARRRREIARQEAARRSEMSSARFRQPNHE